MPNITWLNAKISLLDHLLVSGTWNRDWIKQLDSKIMSNIYQAWIIIFSILPKWKSHTRPSTVFWSESQSPLTPTLCCSKTLYKVPALVFPFDCISPPGRPWKNVVSTDERTWRFSLSVDRTIVCWELLTWIPMLRWNVTCSSWRYSRQENISWLTWQMTLNPALLLGNFPFKYIA